MHFPHTGLVPEPARQVSKAGAAGPAEGLEQQLRLHRAREKREQIRHAQGRQAARIAPVQRLNDAQLECIIASVEQ